MKLKFMTTSLLTFILALVVAIPVFAETGSTSFNLSAYGSSSLRQYIKVDDGGSVTVSVNGISTGQNVKIVVYNPITSGSVSATLSNNQSKTFTNMKGAEYNIRIENPSASNVSGSIGFTWDGVWGRWIE